MHLMSVDLPAPLSPTSAMTSPARTSKSTSSSARTDPKLFETPRVSSLGVTTPAGEGEAIVSVTGRSPVSRRVGSRRSDSPPSCHCLAVLLVRADAHLGLLERSVLVQQVDVLLRDPDRGRKRRRHVPH